MRKIFNIILLAALLCGVISCTDMLDESIRGRSVIDTKPVEVPEGACLTLGFNVPMPVATKAMTETPTIDSIHVFVFSSTGVSPNGSLLEVKKARLSNPHVNQNATMDYEQTPGQNGYVSNGDEATVIARWEVDLMMGRGIRHIHFVANLPEDFVTPDPGADEFSVLRSIQTTGGDVAYWQMVDVEDGILAYTYDGTKYNKYVNENGLIDSIFIENIPGYAGYDEAKQLYKYTIEGETTPYEVGKGDYITNSGFKVLDGGGYYASMDLSRAVNMIPLVRNFARIKLLTTSQSNFRVKKAVLINTPQAGYAAPFDDAANKFVDVYRNIGVEAAEHDDILETGYPATIPGNALITPVLADLEAEIALSDHQAKTNANGTRDSVYLYMYERGIPTQKATSMLVCGTKAGVTGDVWFKIEISDKNGSFFPIYRNFTYEVEIKSIAGSDGYKTMEKALAEDPIGDISNSTETQTLTKIDDGNGLTLWVEYIDHTSTSPDNHSVRLLYKFYKGSNNYTADHVTLRIDPVTGRDPAINSTATTLTRAAYSGNDTPDGANGWYAVDVPLYGNSTITKVSTLHVEGKLNAKTMSRNVNYRVMAKQDFTLSNTGLDDDALNEETTLTITLPDYLGYSVFPLTLMIEAEQNNLNPTDKGISVESGTSLFPTKGNAFYFLKTVEYDDYQASHSVVCHFKTTKSEGNATQIAVVDKEGYFNTAVDDLTVKPTFKLILPTTDPNDPTVVPVSASVTSIEFDIRSNTEGQWTVSASDGAEVIQTRANTVSNTGNATIQVSLPGRNTSETEAKTYTVTVTLDDEHAALIEGYQPQVFTIKQKPVSWASVTRTINTTSSTFTTAGAYTGTTFNSEISTLSFDYSRNGYNELSAVGNNYITLQQSSSYYTTLKISAKSITQIVITWTRENANTWGNNWTNYAVNGDNTSIVSGNGSVTYVAGTGNNSDNPSKTTWTNSGGSDTVSLRFNNSGTARIQRIEITYSHLE